MTNDAHTPVPESTDIDAALIDAAAAQAHSWLASTADEQDPATEQLADLLRNPDGVASVSYTHLTLPTILLV